LERVSYFLTLKNESKVTMFTTHSTTI